MAFAGFSLTASRASPPWSTQPWISAKLWSHFSKFRVSSSFELCDAVSIPEPLVVATRISITPRYHQMQAGSATCKHRLAAQLLDGQMSHLTFYKLYTMGHGSSKWPNGIDIRIQKISEGCSAVPFLF